MKNQTNRQSSDRPITEFSRWGEWEQQVLSKVDKPADCQALINDRRRLIDDDRQEKDLVADQFRTELQRLRHDPDKEVLFIPSAQAADWLGHALGKTMPTNRATTYLRNLGLDELRITKTGGRPGWKWRHPKVTDGQMKQLKKNLSSLAHGR
jgi:hypothetical protein